MGGPWSGRCPRSSAAWRSTVRTVDFNDSGDARAFLAPYGLGFPALLDSSSRVGHAYLVSDLPVTFFIGRDGRVAHVFHGQLSDATLTASLQGLV